MSTPNPSEDRRPVVLIVDDDELVHDAYRRCLRLESRPVNPELRELEAQLFGGGDAEPEPPMPAYELEHAYQGEEAVEMAEAAKKRGRHFSVAFVDMRMPPGIDGTETVRRLWAIDPRILVVICTAYSDFTWAETTSALQRTEGLHLLRKPFEAKQLRDWTSQLVEKARLASP